MIYPFGKYYLFLAFFSILILLYSCNSKTKYVVLMVNVYGADTIKNFLLSDDYREISNKEDGNDLHNLILDLFSHTIYYKNVLPDSIGNCFFDSIPKINFEYLIIEPKFGDLILTPSWDRSYLKFKDRDIDTFKFIYHKSN